jgi:hypothetical protein
VTRRYTLRVTQGVSGRLTTVRRAGLATVTDAHGSVTAYAVTYYRAEAGSEVQEPRVSGALRLGPVADHLLSIVTQAIRRGRHTTTFAVEVGDDTAATAA